MRIDRTRFHDTVLAGVVAAASVALFVLYEHGRLASGDLAVDGVREPDPLGALLVLLACAPVAVRRRWPLAALCAGLVPETLLTGFGYSTGVPGLSGLVLLYSVASNRGLAMALGGLLAAVLAYALGAAAGPPSATTLSDHVVVAMVLISVWGAGRSLRLRRAYMEELRGRAARLERARAADTRAARAEERSRIARELHDVVAHHVSVMTVQAAAARKVLSSDPGLAGEALTAIEHTGRMAMSEMRNIVGVLRTDARAELGPQPGMEDLPALIEQMREAGLPTRLVIEGEPPPLPAGVDLAAYRLVQEGLTNSLRHAGAGAKAVVTVRHAPHELDVRVADDGRGAAGAPGRPGHGLVGIRERVALYGGILSVGPLPGGGFEVRARFPLKDGQ
ncbi:sensor histidine kinase [Nonomuraea sp. KC401]|uniref:sensor histidine kinase n=1 Tax=unclassified Nonomuraea TaxID=2593643 RepID=UPI0010FDB5D5|nr:sensor histidine kinase [Nonomuraea sp. KC401]NBE95871.1 sensor histidine kinase [Nonomuraea sp. K271]TLF83464.1 sensor histidine kinase [Nonomuraea sp. KC401]